MHKKVSKQIKQNKKYISIIKKSDTSITVIYHTVSLTVLLSQKIGRQNNLGVSKPNDLNLLRSPDRRVAPYTPTRSCVHIGVLKKK